MLKLFTTSPISTGSSMNLQPNPEQPPQRILSPSSSRSRASSFRDGFSRYGWVPYFLAGMIVLIMALGLLFVAHQYYIGFGGQGWLKSREELQKQNEIYQNHLVLPLRKQEVWNAGSERRSPQNDVPYYACGDQQNSCQTYNQPVSSDTNIDHMHANMETRIYAARLGQCVTRHPSLCREFSAVMRQCHSSNVKHPSPTHRNA